MVRTAQSTQDTPAVTCSENTTIELINNVNIAENNNMTSYMYMPYRIAGKFGGLPLELGCNHWLNGRRYHNLVIVLSYKAIWAQTIGEHLSCKREMANTEDHYTPRFWSVFTFSLLGTSGLTHSFTCSVSFEREPHSHTGHSHRRYVSRTRETQIELLQQGHVLIVCT